MFKKIIKGIKFLLILLVLAISSFVLTSIAAPPASKYNLGETLAPNCAPGDPNCTVVAPAASGVNADITALTGLTTAITVAQGGTGATTADGARTNLGLGSTDSPTFAGLTLTGNQTLNAQSDLLFADADSSNTVGFQAPNIVNVNVLWTLPATDGTAGQVLSTDGAGGLSWYTPVTQLNQLNDATIATPIAGQILIYDGVDSFDNQTMSGDVIISTTGVTTIQPNSVALTTDTVGNYVASITNGSGISGGDGGNEGSALTLSLGPLTADWNQTGAFDIILNNSSSELKILEAGITPTFYGIFDVADLTTSDKTYTFPDASGEVSLLGQTIESAEITDGTITTVDIADNSVNGAKIALGFDAQGDIMYYNGIDWVRLPAGTAGQFLQTQGAGANPVWAADNTMYNTDGTVGVGRNIALTDTLNFDANTLFIDGTNNKVGIGTATPGQALEVNGGMRLNTATAKPACDATVRGTFWVTQGAVGVKDTVEVCAKDATNVYAWRAIY